MGKQPKFFADGTLVYITDWGAGIVRVYDTRTLEKVTEIERILTATGTFNSFRRTEKLGL